jgi:GT2 family glycosyltransferase
MLLAYSRNAGVAAARGEYIFFVDDDNVADGAAVGNLAAVLEREEKTAVCSPVIYVYGEPDRIWTSTISKGRFPGSYVLGLELPASVARTFSFHDAFMVKRDVFQKLGMFDWRNFPIHFSELDFAYRLEAAGYYAKVNPTARVWHDAAATHMNVDSTRSFYTLRNRIALMKRYEPGGFWSYLTISFPLIGVYYLQHHIRNTTDSKLATALNLIRGTIQGLARPFPKFQSAEFAVATPRPIPAELPMVSVIVPSKNSAETISACLRSLEEQSYPRVEVIVVDNSSTDDTVKIASTFKNVRVIKAGPERSAQLNAAERLSNGKFIYRVDSDFVVEPSVIEEAVMKCLTEGYKAVAIHNTSDPTIGRWARVRKLERDCYVDDKAHIAARFIDRDAF